MLLCETHFILAKSAFGTDKKIDLPVRTVSQGSEQRSLLLAFPRQQIERVFGFHPPAGCRKCCDRLQRRYTTAPRLLGSFKDNARPAHQLCFRFFRARYAAFAQHRHKATHAYLSTLLQDPLKLLSLEQPLIECNLCARLSSSRSLLDYPALHLVALHLL